MRLRTREQSQQRSAHLAPQLRGRVPAEVQPYLGALQSLRVRSESVPDVSGASLGSWSSSEALLVAACKHRKA